MRNLFIIIAIATILSSCNTIIFLLAKKPSHKISNINFDNNNKSNYTFIYPDTLGDLILRQIRVENNLTQLVVKANSDKEKALLILNWTHSQWTHSGSNTPSKFDALTILKEAKLGESFRCVEYGIVAKSALLSIGIKARSLGLQTKDVETCKFGAGHALSEVWLSDLNKWALIDGQFNIMPVLNNVPLNAVEFQKAIIDKKPFILLNSKGEISKKEYSAYMNFIPHYLFYFTIGFDQREVASGEKHKVEGKSSLMLVPLTAKQPTVFQKKFPNTDYVYTNSLGDFYSKP